MHFDWKIVAGGRLYRLVRRLRFAKAFRMWPWAVPDEVVRYLMLPSEIRITPRDIAKAKELAERFGIGTDGDQAR